jgi:hypothetical protein
MSRSLRRPSIAAFSPPVSKIHDYASVEEGNRGMTFNTGKADEADPNKQKKNLLAGADLDDEDIGVQGKIRKKTRMQQIKEILEKIYRTFSPLVSEV